MPLVASFLAKQLPLSAYHPQKPPPPDPLAIPGHSWPSLAAFKAQVAGGESGAEGACLQGTVQGASGTSFTLHLGDAQLLAVAVDEACRAGQGRSTVRIRLQNSCGLMG
jgi:hypothetical protein